MFYDVTTKPSNIETKRPRQTL